MTRKVTKTLLVACLAWGMIPGLALAAENLWSVATTGQLAHAPAVAEIDGLDGIDGLRRRLVPRRRSIRSTDAAARFTSAPATIP